MLKGSSISLRPVTEVDLEQIFRTSLDIETRGPWYPLPQESLSKFKASFAESGFWSADNGKFAIVDGEDQLIGLVAWGKLELDYGADMEVAYRIFDRAAMGKGVTTEAVNLLVDYLFGWQPIHRVILYIHVDNAPSQRVAEKCGFTKEGTAREGWFHRGGWHDLAIYSLLRSEHETRTVTLSARGTLKG